MVVRKPAKIAISARGSFRLNVDERDLFNLGVVVIGVLVQGDRHFMNEKDAPSNPSREVLFQRLHPSASAGVGATVRRNPGSEFIL